MKAIWFERLGGPEVLEVRDVPDPVPGDGEVLVDVEAVGVNYRDVYERTREHYGVDPPAVIGAEAGGTTRRRRAARLERRAAQLRGEGRGAAREGGARFPTASPPTLRSPCCCRA